MNKRDELYDVSTYYTKFLKYDLFWHQIEGIGHIQLNNPIGVKVQGAFDAINYYFTIAFSCNFELMRGKMCCKGIVELKAQIMTCELI